MEIILPDKHPLFTTSKEVTEICRPLFKHFNIKHFAYVCVFEDLSRIHLSNSMKWSRHFYENAFRYHKTEKITEFSHSLSGWTTFDCLNETHCVRDAREHNIGSGLVISENNGSHTELFYMALSHDDSSSQTNSVNLFQNMNSLKSFNKYFKKHASKLIKFYHQDLIHIPFLEEVNKSPRHFLDNDNIRKQFLEEIKPGLCSITLKEYECAEYLLQGYGLDKITTLMNISYRTLEKHMSALRRKTLSRSTIELLHNLRNYFQ